MSVLTAARATRTTMRLCVAVPLWLVAVSLATNGLHAQSAISRTRQHVETLASPQFEGREAGSRGEQLAGDYIAAQLARLGAKPLPASGGAARNGMFMPFTFAAATKDAGSLIKISRSTTATAPTGNSISGGTVFVADKPSDVQALSFSDNTDEVGPVVFAGYGIVVPESQNFGYD